MKTKKTTLVLMLLAFGLVTSLFGQTTPYPTPTHKVNPEFDEFHNTLPQISTSENIGSDYMTTYWNYFKKKTLSQLVLLGSHHFTYSGLPLCAPQTKSVSQQIKAGVRYGDVRFDYQHNTGGNTTRLYADHGSLCAAESGESKAFRNEVKDVKSILGNNDFFILHVKEFYNLSEDGPDADTALTGLGNAIEYAFGSELITPQELKDNGLELLTATLEQLRPYGKIIVTTAYGGGSTQSPGNLSYWDGSKGDKTLGSKTYSNVGALISYPNLTYADYEPGETKSLEDYRDFLKASSSLNCINSLGYSVTSAPSLPESGDKYLKYVTAQGEPSTTEPPLQTYLTRETTKGFILNVDGVGYSSEGTDPLAVMLLKTNIARSLAPALGGVKKQFLEDKWYLTYGWLDNYTPSLSLELWHYNDNQWQRKEDFNTINSPTPKIHEVNKPGHYYMVNKNSGFRSQIVEAKTLIRKRRSSTSDVIAHWSFNDNLKEYFSEELDLTERLNRYSFVTGKVKNAVRLKSGSLELKETMKISSGDFTISTWVRRHSLGGDSNILLGRYPNRGSITIGWDEEGRFEIFDEKTDGNTSKKFLQYGTSAKPAIPINTWVHVMVTRKGNAMKLFLNGVIVKEDTWKAGDNTLLMSAIRANGSTHTDFDEYKIHHTAHEVVPYFPIAHWTMDPLSPTTCCTSSLPDATGNGHTANIKGDDKVIHLGVNPISGINDAKVNGAIAWSEGVPKYFVLNSQIDLTNSFTIASWVKFIGSINNKDAIVGKNGPGNDINFHNGYPRLYNGSSDVVISKIAISNTWAHVAVTRDESNNLKIYVNGIETGTGNWSGTFTIKSIGAGNETPVKEGGNKYFDDLRIYNRALSAHEISILPGFSGSSSKRAKTKLLNVKEDAILSSINLYPNPATYAFSFTVPTEFKQSKVNVSISDISGKIVQSTILQNNNTNNLSVKTNTLSNGLYFVKIDIGDTSVTKKLLINK